MIKMPKFTDAIDISKIDLTETSKKIKDIKLNEEFEYIGNLSEDEIDQFIELVDNNELFTEVDESGEVKSVDFIKLSKDVLDELTDGKWTSFSKEEKKAFLNNYIWDGYKFVPTKTGRVKAGVVGAVSDIVDQYTSIKNIFKNLSLTFLSKVVVSKVKGNVVNSAELLKLLKATPKGAALGSILNALVAGAVTAINTTPTPEVNDKGEKINKDYASTFDSTLKVAKEKVRDFFAKFSGK